MSLIFQASASDCIERDSKGVGDGLSGGPFSLEGEGCDVVVLLTHTEMYCVTVKIDSGALEWIVLGNGYQSLCGDIGTTRLDGSDPRKAIARHEIHNLVRQVAALGIPPKLFMEAHVEARASACFEGARRATCETAKKIATPEKLFQAPPSL